MVFLSGKRTEIASDENPDLVRLSTIWLVWPSEMAMAYTDLLLIGLVVLVWVVDSGIAGYLEFTLSSSVIRDSFAWEFAILRTAACSSVDSTTPLSVTLPLRVMILMFLALNDISESMMLERMFLVTWVSDSLLPWSVGSKESSVISFSFWAVLSGASTSPPMESRKVRRDSMALSLL